MGALHGQGPRSCEMESEVLEHFRVFRQISVYSDVDRHRIGPFEVRECAVEVMAGPKLEASPEGWSGYESRTPILADVCSCDQISLADANFENS